LSTQFSFESVIVKMFEGGPGASGAALSAEEKFAYDSFDLTGAKPPGNSKP
jgi:hypothetical protein